MPKARRARDDLVVALALLAFAAGYGGLALRLPERNIPGSVGLDFVPLLLAGTLAMLATGLLIGAIRRPAVAPAGESPGWGQAGLVVSVMLVYILALPYLGFWLATPPYLAVTMWQSGARRPGVILVTAMGLSLALWAVFIALFAVPLPRGSLF